MRDKYLELPEVSRRGFLQATLIAAAAAAPVAASDCARTSRSIQGPYWKPDAPMTRDIRNGKRGQNIIVRGVVRGGAPCVAIEGALIDVWQADADGKYDLDYGREENFLRGRVRTGPGGSYEFETIRPAPYGLVGHTRPAHIHFMVTAPGRKRLVTQLYFAGDPNLDSDPFGAVYPDLIVSPKGGVARFDITLA
jgi:protocatechuate 3,4-dioxygenase beta subunit